MNEWLLGGIIVVVTLVLIGGGSMLINAIRGPRKDSSSKS